MVAYLDRTIVLGQCARVVHKYTPKSPAHSLSHCAVRADTEIVLPSQTTSARVRFDPPNHPLICDNHPYALCAIHDTPSATHVRVPGRFDAESDKVDGNKAEAKGGWLSNPQGARGASKMLEMMINDIRSLAFFRTYCYLTVLARAATSYRYSFPSYSPVPSHLIYLNTSRSRIPSTLHPPSSFSIAGKVPCTVTLCSTSPGFYDPGERSLSLRFYNSEE